MDGSWVEGAPTEAPLQSINLFSSFPGRHLA
jgi:hypothetical protein